jgi:hypothetical protein
LAKRQPLGVALGDTAVVIADSRALAAPLARRIAGPHMQGRLKIEPLPAIRAVIKPCLVAVPGEMPIDDMRPILTQMLDIGRTVHKPLLLLDRLCRLQSVLIDTAKAHEKMRVKVAAIMPGLRRMDRNLYDPALAGEFADMVL